mgnify:CR=1 FL=1
MPEVRHNFTGGKMNKDLDERLVPNGQYRHALNVEVSTSEGSDVGTVQNILGNKRVDTLVGSDFNCVGSIADEKNNKLYWFISKYDKDVILEYDIEQDIASPVLVDKKAGTGKAVLKFFGNIITGINIIDDLLFWSDNKGEPKKINIKRCKEGTPNIDTHTQISFGNNSFTGIAVEYTFSNVTEIEHPPLLSLKKMAKVGKYTTFERRRLAAAVGIDFNDFVDDFGNIKDANGQAIITTSQNSFDANGVSSTGNLNTVPGQGYMFKARHYRGGELLNSERMRAFDNKYGLQLRTNDNTLEKDLKVGDVIFAENKKLDIEEKHITVIKPKPLKAPSVKINYKEQTKTTNKKPNLFEEQFPRFSYRYKYADGEFSAFAPFTEPVFNPQYTQNTDKSTDGSVLHSKDDIYDIKDPKNKAMVNAIHSVDLMDFITINTPEDVVEVDLLYKKEDSPVVYSIGTVKHTDFEWHASIFNNEHGQSFIGGVTRYDININDVKPWMPAADGGYNSGRYTVKNENIYAALPANQLLRPWDNVPRKALAQEVSGSRIVYGNYLQNYTIGSKPKVFIDYTDRKKTIGSFDTKGLPSIKSQRNYQLGVIYCDEFGRETPVFTSSSGAVNIPWAENDGSKNASKSNQIIASVNTNFPDWVDSIKFFVKENSGEYYNLAMERAWTGKSTYELDNSEGHLWMSFPSSDRNKISKEDSIILKKKIGVGEEQVSFENKFSVIDIQDEAPDAIKYELVNLGTWHNNSINAMTDQAATSYDRLFAYPSNRPDKFNQDVITIDISAWHSGGQYRDELIMGDAYVTNASTGTSEQVPENLYVSWFRIGGAFSSKYKVSGGWKGTGGYVLKLNRDITEKDANVAHVNGTAVESQNETHVHEDLVFQVEKKVAKDDENFSGQFFVKISKNHITSIVETGNELSNLDKFQVTADQGVWYWRDDTNGSQNLASNPNNFSFQGGAPYGLTNYFGVDAEVSISSSNNIQAAGGGNVNDNALGGTARLTDWHEMWENILSELDGKPRWFIDSMHMASGQSDESDYAKYNCVTWAGSTFNPSLTLNDDNLSTAWSYPPLKKWFTEISDNEIEVEGSEGNYFTEGNANIVISTSNLFDANEDWLVYDESENAYGNETGNVGLQIDGWVGVPQNVSRVNYPQTSAGNLRKALNHINGLEGLVTTNEHHTTGPRRWVSGMNGTEFGNGEDTKTYSSTGDETEKHFMHLSFFAPGKDLHDNTWHFTGSDSDLYGKDSWMDNLQGIWGGGVFTGKSRDDKFGTAEDNENKHFHLAMEGNYADGEDNDHQVLSTPPGPGSGFGYDISKNYRELHERQWDPTFGSGNDPDNRIRDFIRNLHAGSRFRFNKKIVGAAGTTAELDDAVYTIKKVHVKKLYNHTSWRTPHNQFFWQNGGYVWDDPSLVHDAYNSVEDTALIWLNNVDQDGEHTTTMNDDAGSTYGISQQENFKKKIVDFGAAHNRRVCYIIELDKNPTASTSSMGNPLDSNVNGVEAMTANLDNDSYTYIEFLDPVQDAWLRDLSKFPAIWELSPKKQDVDLDIYYEASNNIPVRIDRHTNELFAPKGCLVEMVNPPVNQSYNKVRLVEWNGNTAILEPGFDRGADGEEVDYSDVKFKFIRRDGSYTVANTGLQQLITETDGYKTNFVFKQNIGAKIQVGLAWYNCFSFGNGLESNRIEDGFNNMFIVNGVKASTTIQETYEEEHRKHGIIYSGLYNSNSGINDLNQFIMAEKITKDLNPTYGSIQKLFSRDTDLVTFCEDKVLRILANKDAVFNADGNAQLTANQNVLGQAVPFQGEYGISKNPESFAAESYRAYFTDKQRGAVLRLSKDGLTPISKAGMHDWFRDNLSKHTSLIGTYDSYKENYNITLANTYTENIIFNTFFRLGAESEAIDASVLSSVASGAPVSGSSYRHTWENPDGSSNILTSNQYNFGGGSSNAVDQKFKNTITVTNHPGIPKGYFQEELVGSGSMPAPVIAQATSVLEGYVAPTPFQAGQAEQQYQAEIQAQAEIQEVVGVDYAPPVYSSWTSAALFDQGHVYSVNNYSQPTGFSGWPTRTYSGNRLFGPNATAYSDTNIDSKIARIHNGSEVDESSQVNSQYTHQNYTVEPVLLGGFGTVASGGNDPDATGTILQRHSTGDILFNRIEQTTNNYNTYVEFRDLGVNDGYGNSLYNSAVGNPGNGAPYKHSAMYAGDEIEIRIKIRVNDTSTSYNAGGSSWTTHTSYNIINPFIEIRDGGSSIPSSKIMPYAGLTSNPSQQQPGNLSFGTDPWYYWQQPIAGTSGGYVSSAGGSGTTYHDGVQYDSDHVGAKTMTSSIYKFGDTITTNNGGTLGTPLPETYTIVARVKFKSPNQTYYNPLSGGSGITTGFVDEKVIDDLQLRIGNWKKNSTSTYPNNGNYLSTEKAQCQKWEITSVKIRKLIGIIAPDTEFVQAVAGQAAVAYQAEVPYLPFIAEVPYDPGYAGDWVTYWDDPATTGTIEQLTANQLTAIYSGATINADGDYVVNQSAINTWNNNNPGGVVYPQDAIPPQNVDAFVEVSYSNPNWQYGLYNTGTNFVQWHTPHDPYYFGNPRGAIYKHAYKTDPTTGNLTNQKVEWYEAGNDPHSQDPQEGNYDNVGNYFSKTLTDGDGTVYYPPPPAYTNSVIPNGLGLDYLSGSYVTRKTYEDFVSDWWVTYTHSTSSSSTSISFPLSTDDELQVGEWYMVDVELNDDQHPGCYDADNMPSEFGDPNAHISVLGVIDDNILWGYNLGEMGGYGTVTGGPEGTSGNIFRRNARCAPVFRTRYNTETYQVSSNSTNTDNKWVFRTVFKLSSNSWASNHKDKITLRFYNWNVNTVGRLYIDKVVCKKVSYVNGTGAAEDWNRFIYNDTDHHLQVNALTESKLYYRQGMLCYDNCKQTNNYLNGTSGLRESFWNQEFATGKEITNTGSGWILNFKINPNPKTSEFNGVLGVKVTGPAGDVHNPNLASVNHFDGMMANVDCIDHPINGTTGEYKIKFNTSGIKDSSWSIEDANGAYSAPYFDEYSASGWTDVLTTNNPGAANSIGFYNASSSTPLSCGVSDIYLTQRETIFSGGQAGSWNFDGFDSTSEQFVTWDRYWPDGMVGTDNIDGRIQFSSCPNFDPGFGNGNIMISANQYIDKVINRYEKYEISFNFRMQEYVDVNGELTTVGGTGLLHMYYFNGSGYGFRINDIGDGTDSGFGVEGSTPVNPNYTKTAVNDSNGDFMWWRVTKIVTICVGDDSEAKAYSEYQSQGVEALRDTLVIRRDDTDSQDLTGWIDDISMKRVYDVEMTPGPDGIPGNEDDVPVYPETTLTFSENVRGWTSFKSFIPESGLSLSKKYFTIKDGYLYQHYKPLKRSEDTVHWEDCNYSEAENYNHFYDHLPVSQHNYSEVVAVINAEPNIVKTFKTISYEGSQAHVTNPGAPALEKPEYINQDNAIAWALNDYVTETYPDVDGWKCVDIKTDLDDGKLLDFIKKEGKWFGYIRGKRVVGKLDASKFSVQGIGGISSLDSITPLSSDDIGAGVDNNGGNSGLYDPLTGTYI